jgi:CRP-like cAMP-binding protein
MVSGDKMNDPEIIDNYSRLYNIRQYFSHWDEYKKVLVRFPKNSMICMSGEALNCILILVEGSIDTRIISADGRYSFVGTNRPLTILGDIEFSGKYGLTESECSSDTVCISISLSGERKLLEDDRKFLMYICRALAEKISDAVKDKYDTHFITSRKKLIRVILAVEKNKLVKCNWSDTAGTIGISYRQVMRILSGLVSKGLISRGKKIGEYMICDRKSLEKYYAEL